MSAYIRCSICGKMIEVDSWWLVAYMEEEANGEIKEPFVCTGCR